MKFLILLSLLNNVMGTRVGLNPPDWITGEIREGFVLAADLCQFIPIRSHQELEELVDDSSIDVFTSWYHNSPQSSVPPVFIGISGVDIEEFKRAAEIFDVEQRTIDLIVRFWFNRPAWYIPDDEHISHIEYAFLERFTSPWYVPESYSADFLVLARVISILGPAVCSPRTQLRYRRPTSNRIPHSVDLYSFFEARMNSPVLRQLVDEAVRASHLNPIQDQQFKQHLEWHMELVK